MAFDSRNLVTMLRSTPGCLVVVLLGLLAVVRGQIPSQNLAADLAGTAWQLVKFQGGDDTTLIPEDRSKYTVAFASSGDVNLRIDCNRGHGTWKSPEPHQLEFGSMALTRAMCPPAPLNDRLAKDWQYVRSYTLKDGHLFLALQADAGTYEFEPTRQGETAAEKVKGTATYRERMVLPPRCCV